jgi:hypothetical protein
VRAAHGLTLPQAADDAQPDLTPAHSSLAAHAVLPSMWADAMKAGNSEQSPGIQGGPGARPICERKDWQLPAGCA